MSTAPPIWFVAKCSSVSTSHCRLVRATSHQSESSRQHLSSGDVVLVGMAEFLSDVLSQCCTEEERACNMLCLSSHVFPALMFSSNAQCSLDMIQPCVTHPAELFAVLYRLYSCLTSQLDRQLSLRVVDDFSKRCDGLLNQPGAVSFLANLSHGDALPLDNSLLLQVCGVGASCTSPQEAEWTRRRCVALRIRQNKCTCNGAAERSKGEANGVQMNFTQIAQRLWRTFQRFGSKPDCENDLLHISIKECPVAICCRRFSVCQPSQVGRDEICPSMTFHFSESLRLVSVKELLDSLDRRKHPSMLCSEAQCEAHCWEDFLIMMRSTHDLLVTSEGHDAVVAHWASPRRENDLLVGLPMMTHRGGGWDSETSQRFGRAWREAELLPDETTVDVASHSPRSSALLAVSARERILRGGAVAASSEKVALCQPTAHYKHRRKTIQLTTSRKLAGAKRMRDAAGDDMS